MIFQIEGVAMRKMILVVSVWLLLGVTAGGAPVWASGGGLLDLIDALGSSGSSQEAKHKVSYVEGNKEAEDEILLIKIRGIIKEAEDGDSMPFEIKKNMMESVKKDLEVARDRKNVKAVLLEIDSPGGEVTASDILHHQLSKVKTVKKPMVALIGTLGTSGAYYIACAADQIWAHPTSILGSIGVLMQGMNIQKLADLIGLKDVTIKSSKTPRKDIMSPFREMTPEEKAMLLSLIDSMYDRFVKIVADGRKKKVEEIEPLADGSLYTSDQALKNGLIDGVGYREDVINQIKTLANLKEAKLVRRRTKKGLSEFFADLAEMHSGVPAFLSGVQNMIELEGTPTLLYQTKPLK
jgi:protease-4